MRGPGPGSRSGQGRGLGQPKWAGARARGALLRVLPGATGDVARPIVPRVGAQALGSERTSSALHTSANRGKFLLPLHQRAVLGSALRVPREASPLAVEGSL